MRMALNRCTAIDMRWNKKVVSRGSLISGVGKATNQFLKEIRRSITERTQSHESYHKEINIIIVFVVVAVFVVTVVIVIVIVIVIIIAINYYYYHY